MIYSYRRVSTDDQPNGPDAQRDTIERWVVSNGFSPGMSCTKEFYDKLLRQSYVDFFDNGVSGSIPLFERPQGKLLGERIENDETPPTIVVAKLDRLFRSVADAATTIAHWDKIGVKMVSVAEGFDMTNPYGKAMCQMASVFAELEREMIRSRTKAALAAKKARGECIGEVPYGWERVGGKLVDCNYEQRIMSMILHMRGSEMLTHSQIANKLNSASIKAKKGGRWTATQVKRIIERGS